MNFDTNVKMKSIKYVFLVLAGFLVTTTNVGAKSPEWIFSKASKSVVLVKSFGSSRELLSTGSGVVISTEEVITSCHVLKFGQHFSVGKDNDYIEATLLYADRKHDLCLLIAPELKNPKISLGVTRGLKVGSAVYAIGAPRGLELSLSDGVISQIRGEAEVRLIQTTAPISPGSSGGGLFDKNGDLIGITSIYLKDSQNLNFAVPVDWVKKIKSSKNLIKSGRLDDDQDSGSNSVVDLSTVMPPVSESGWDYVGMDDDFSKIYLNIITRRNNSGPAVAWTLSDYPSPQKNNIRGHSFKSSTALNLYDCQANGFANIAGLEHYGQMAKGDVLSEYRWPKSKVRYTTFEAGGVSVPSMMLAKIMKKVCDE